MYAASTAEGAGDSLTQQEADPPPAQRRLRGERPPRPDRKGGGHHRPHPDALTGSRTASATPGGVVTLPHAVHGRGACALRSHRHARASRNAQRAEDGHADVNSRGSVFCSDPLDRRAQVNLCNLLRSATPRSITPKRAASRYSVAPRASFHEYQPTRGTFQDLFAHLRRDRIIPP
jgi:hypothetical protein